MTTFAIPFPMIDPVALSIGPVSIKWYGLAYVAGLLGGWLYARQLLVRDSLWGDVKRPTLEDMDDLLVWVALGIVIGGRLGYVLFYDLESFLERPQDIIAVWQGGMSFHGGLAGAMTALWLFARRRQLKVITVYDLMATVGPIGLFFGRLANFINDELWGRIAPDFAYAVVFPSGGPVPRHPSQLYEAATEGVLLFLLLALVVRRFGFRRPGLVSGVFAAGYAIARIGCEFFREPDPQLGFLFGTTAGGGGITMGMVLSVPLLAAGLYLILRARKTAQLPAGA